MEYKDKFALLVLSCDKYKFAWDDFFNLRDMFWPDCPYKWYLVTESEDYKRDNVIVIKCGKEMNWTGRFKHAIEVSETKYVGMYLEDYFIDHAVDNNIIEDDVALMEKLGITMLNVGDEFGWLCSQPNKKYVAEHVFDIPKHLRSGVGAVPAIWESDYMIKLLGEKDCNPWEFEVDRNKEAASVEGTIGYPACDERRPFNVSKCQILIQGKLYPRSIKHFKKRGYVMDASKYELMSNKEIFRWKFKHYSAKIPFGRPFLKWVGTHVFGYEFCSDTYK